MRRKLDSLRLLSVHPDSGLHELKLGVQSRITTQGRVMYDFNVSIALLAVGDRSTVLDIIHSTIPLDELGALLSALETTTKDNVATFAISQKKFTVHANPVGVKITLFDIQKGMSLDFMLRHDDPSTKSNLRVMALVISGFISSLGSVTNNLTLMV